MALIICCITAISGGAYTAFDDAGAQDADGNQNCTGCTNCRNCRNCSNCHNCNGCANCAGSQDCYSCANCMSSRACRNCRNCVNCDDCDNCTNTTNCRSRQNCRNCNCNQFFTMSTGFNNQLTESLMKICDGLSSEADKDVCSKIVQQTVAGVSRQYQLSSSSECSQKLQNKTNDTLPTPVPSTLITI